MTKYSTTGYTGSGEAGACGNVDECMLGTHNCDSNAMCTDASGTFNCQCNEGYSGDGVRCIGNKCISNWQQSFQKQIHLKVIN